MRRSLCFAALLAVQFLAPHPAHAQQQAPEGAAAPESFWVEIDHGTRKAMLYRRRAGVTTSSPIAFEGEFRIPTGMPTPVYVVNSNSALYTCSVAQGRAAVPEIEQVKGFLTAFGPYLTDFSLMEALNELQAMTIPADSVAPASPLERARAAVVADLTRLQFAAAEANRTRILTLRALEAMRDQPDEVDAHAEDLTDDLTCDGSCADRDFVDQIITHLDALMTSLNALEVQMLVPGVVPDTQTVRVAADARKVVEGADAIIAGAYATRRVADVTMAARTRVECDQAVEVTRTSGRALTMTVAPRALPETQRLATRASMEVKATALPRFRFVPAVGLSLMYAPQATYSKVATVKAPGDSVEIVQVGEQDSRLTYGLTLAARLDGLVPGENLRIYLPELTINPTENVRSIGLGAAISAYSVKVGVGALWTRHPELSDQQQFGQRLRAAEFLQTENRYSPSMYISFSVVGWPPFLSGGGAKAEEKK